MIYGYCRVSTNHQRIVRQVNNIKEIYPRAEIVNEWYSGTTQSRPLWESLIRRAVAGDTIVFDSVSRMSRNTEEGFRDYKSLYERGINLVFLKEPLINTSVFDSTKNHLLEISVQTGNDAVDNYFKDNVRSINTLLMSLAEEQIKAAFVQSEKEVLDLHSRISEGIREAKKNGSKIGLAKGTKLTTKKEKECELIIQRHSKDFGGSLDDPEVIKLCGCSRVSYYKYKKALKLRKRKEG